MKKLLSTIMLALVGMTAQAQKEVVWQNPSAFMGASSSEFVITKVELKQTETVLHILANYSPGSWIRFAKESFLQTPDGAKYNIMSGAKTSEQEYDLQLDSLFWMPQSGKACLALHFNPVPMDTKQMDFLEGYNDGDFKFWNICDGNTSQETVLPDDWKDVNYTKDETLPIAKINKGIATVKVKMLGYKPAMKLKFHVGGFTPLSSRDSFDKEFPFADDGTLTVEIPLWLAREVTVGIQGMSFPKIIIAPGQETSILLKVTNDQRPFLAFKGYMAKTNMDLIDAYSKFEPYRDNDSTFLKVKNCNTKEERLQCLTDIFNQRVADIKATKYTKAAKDLLCMAAEDNFVKWTRQFAFIFSEYGVDDDGIIYRTIDHFDEKLKMNEALLPLSQEEIPYTFKYLNEPASPCSSAFWQRMVLYFDKTAAEKNAFNLDLLKIPFKLANDSTILEIIGDITNEDCLAVLREYEAEQLRIADQLTNQENVFYQKFDDVAPENILQTILDRYKDKAVLIDIWATWCGPCRAGHQMMKPMKEDMKGKNIKFVYLTPPSSPLDTWYEMIKDINGDHYYLTDAQYNYILNKYESNGIPTYAIYDTQGQQTFKHIGFPGVDRMRTEIEKALK